MSSKPLPLTLNISFNSIVMPTAGTGESYTDVYWFVPMETRFERVYSTLHNVGAGLAGNLAIQIVQQQPDQTVRGVSSKVVVPRNLTQPLRLIPLSQALLVGLPVYIRVTASVPTGGGTAWWVGAQLKSTAHLSSQEADL